MSKIMSVLEKLRVVEEMKVEENKAEGDKSEENKSKEDMEVIKGDEVSHEASEKEDVSEDNGAIANLIHEEPVIEKSNLDDITKKFSADEFYKLSNMTTGELNTVFMLGNFINALPDSLPNDVKKASVLSIIKAANLELSNLIKDGQKRKDLLTNYYQNFDVIMTKAIGKDRADIDSLKKMIKQKENEIAKKEKMAQEQHHLVNFEVEKISNIIDFFK